MVAEPHGRSPALAERFARFVGESRGSSPLYAHLSSAIAVEPEVASVLTAAPPTQRRPNLLFAAVHDLLLGGLEHPVAAYYPSVGGGSPPDGGTFAAFRDLLESHHDDVVARVRSRRTQTNEPGRCAALRPALGWLAIRTGRPVALVELGASAGLLLHLDRYRYRYASTEVGPSSSPVVIAPALIGCPPTELGLPPLYARLGVDLDPLSPAVEEDARWLRACVWPEAVERLARLDAALEVARTHDDVELVRGDLVSELEPTARRFPPDVVVCVLHSAALAYLDASDRAAVEAALEALGGDERDLVRISLEGLFVEPYTGMERDVLGEPHDEVRMLVGATTWMDGVREDHVLGRSHPHGAWLDWMPYVP